MKSQVLIVFCICLVQICYGYGSFELNDTMKNELRQRIRYWIDGVSERFIDDAITIFDKYQDERYVTKSVSKSLMRRLISVLEHENITKIDVNSMQKYKSNVEFSREGLARQTEYWKVLQSIFSKRLQPEQSNAMTNLMYATFYPNATTEEIESALNYLYGTGTTVDIKDPLANIPDPTPADCPEELERYSTVQDKLKSMTDINPVVLQNVAAISEKFPCDGSFPGARVPTFLEDFVEIINELHVFERVYESKISACMIKEHSNNNFGSFNYLLKRGPTQFGGYISKGSLGGELKDIELILSTRLTDETFRGIINFEKAIILESPIDEIQRALEYVFIDVPKPDCSTGNKNKA